jgi:hypothetical protein
MENTFFYIIDTFFYISELLLVQGLGVGRKCKIKYSLLQKKTTAAYYTPWQQVWEDEVVPEAVLASCLMRQKYLSHAVTATPLESEKVRVTTAGAALFKGAVHAFTFAWQLPVADVHAFEIDNNLYSPLHYYAGQARGHVNRKKTDFPPLAVLILTGNKQAVWGMFRVS